MLLKVGIPNLVLMQLLMAECHIHFLGHFDLDLRPSL